MISKIVSSNSGVFRCLIKQHLFCASDVGFRSDRRFNQEVLTAQGMTDFKSVTQYMIQKKDMNLTDLKLIAQKLISIRYSISLSENVGLINNKLKQLDYSTLDIDTLSNICGIVPILNQHQTFNTRSYQAISHRITELLQEPDKLTDQNLIRFMETLSDAERIREMNIVISLFKNRMPNLRFKDYIKYLGLVMKRKLPTKVEKQIFMIFIAKMQTQIQKIDMKITINLFRCMKNINPFVYNCNNIIQSLQEKIMQNIDDLEENEILMLVELQYSNKFSKIIFRKILDSISDNGESSIASNTIFKILNRLTKSEDIRLYGQENEAKFLKYLEKNLQRTYQIVQLIKKNFLSRNQLSVLNKSIFENDVEWYRKSYAYLYEIAMRGIAHPDSFKTYFESFKNENPSPSFSDKYISTILMLDRAGVMTKGELGPQVKLLKENAIKSIEHFKDPFNIRNPYSIRKNKMLQYFNKKFGNLFVNSLIEKVTKDNQKLNNLVFNYLILANDIRSLMRLQRHNKLSISFQQQKVLLQKVNNNPINFKGNFETINRLFIETEQLRNDVVRKLITYMCNWEIHHILSPEEVGSFLKLSQILLKKQLIKSPILNDYVSYFIRSPSHLIKNSVQYVNLLHEIQAKRQIMERKPYRGLQQKGETKPEGQAQNSENKQVKKQETKLQIIPMIQAAIQMTKYNALEMDYAQKLSEKNLKEFLKNYVRIARGQEFNSAQTPIQPQNILLITKCRSLRESQLEPMMPQIKQKIKALSPHQTQTCLLNYEMKWSSLSSQIYRLLLNRYTEHVRQGKEAFKVQILLRHLHSLHRPFNQYKQLLKEFTQYSSKHFARIPLSAHYFLLKQCTDLGVESAKVYSEKILGNLEAKVAKFQLNSTNFEHIFYYAILHDEQTALKLFHQIQKTQNSFYLSKRFFQLLNLIDPTNKKTVNQIKNILDHQKQPMELQEGIFRYLVAINNDLAELESKFKLVPVRQISWIREKLIQYCEKNNIKFETQEKYGHHFVKIGGKHIFFSKKPFSHLADQKMKKYYSTLFGFSGSNTQMLILCTNDLKKNHLCHILSQQIPQFKDQKYYLMNIMKQRKYNYENQSKEESDSEIAYSQQGQKKSTEGALKKRNQKPEAPKSQDKQTKQATKQEKNPKDSWQN